MYLKLARKCERCCCLGATYFPLFFVYSLTTWALWVVTTIGFLSAKTNWVGSGTSFLGIVLYLLLNWCYTTAVFTNPGTTTIKNEYSSIPSQVPSISSNLTVKANGGLRYCKKCQARKPDRAHHCSTCKVCVLKMDHHCPWLATCVGLRNYKAFLLFLFYTTLFCFLCFGVSGYWVWREIANEGQYTESLMPINYVILVVISGIIGLMLAGFTGWHILLASRGQTTIECLEKTRYLSSTRKSKLYFTNSFIEYSQNSDNIYAEANGNSQPMHELDSSRIHTGERVSYNEFEQARSRLRYQEYLDEQDSAKLPSAFDLGWKMNFFNLFGPNKLHWFIPVATTIQDGWNWEPNPKWLIARERIIQEREEQVEREQAAGWGSERPSQFSVNTQDSMRTESNNSRISLDNVSSDPFSRPISKADRVLGRTFEYSDNVILNNLRPRSSNDCRQAHDSIDPLENRAIDRKAVGI
ncbi:putative palmitoyltransferase pfa3 [Erysiphe necator]|uniref:Palmitoyltransferase n=1 Tax=Uncinula necator TaxID=52586 RepID=A0A0B1PEX6_UNCNE|nr:putative palmitoyltransferase pfa3 [Erysiphe necator]